MQNGSMEDRAAEALHPAADQEDEKRLWVKAQPMRFHRRMKQSWAMLAQQKVLTGFRAMDSTRLIRRPRGTAEFECGCASNSVVPGKN